MGGVYFVGFVGGCVVLIVCFLFGKMVVRVWVEVFGVICCNKL